MPDLRYLTTSTSDNSINPCHSVITGATNCEDYDECNGMSLDDDAPICCTAFQGCFGATNITNKVSLNDSIIDKTAIRCDGSSSYTDTQSLYLLKMVVICILLVLVRFMT